MKTIKLTKGYCAIVDDIDFKKLNKYKWYYSSQGYAVRRPVIEGKHKTIYLHRIVNNTPQHLFTDHINRNRLDNRRKNLRTVTWAENRNNSSGHKDNKSNQHHIDFQKRLSKWRVRFQNFKSICYQSSHSTLQEAIESRDSYLRWKIKH